MISRLQSLRAGASLPWRSARLILRQPDLLLLSLFPIAITLVLYFVGIGWLTERAQGVLCARFIDWGLDPDGLALRVLDLMTSLVLLLVAAVTFAFTSSIVASPFNDLLSSRAERYSDPPLAPVAVESLARQLRLIWIDLAKALAAGFVSCLALLVCWIPVINLISFVSAFLLVTFQYLSYPQTRRGIGIREGSRFLWRHAWACLGFGAVASLLFAVPLVSSLALPVCVVGGTLLAARCPGSDGRRSLR